MTGEYVLKLLYLVAAGTLAWAIYRIRMRAGFRTAAVEAFMCFVFPFFLPLVLIHTAVAEWPALSRATAADREDGPARS